MYRREPERKWGCLMGILSIPLFYLAAAGIAWQYNNPKANQTTFWTHLPEALTFRALPQFQEFEER